MSHQGEGPVPDQEIKGKKAASCSDARLQRPCEMEKQAGGLQILHVWTSSHWGISVQNKWAPGRGFLLCLQMLKSCQKPWALITASKLETAGAVTKAIPLRGLFTPMSAVWDGRCAWTKARHARTSATPPAPVTSIFIWARFNGDIVFLTPTGTCGLRDHLKGGETVMLILLGMHKAPQSFWRPFTSFTSCTSHDNHLKAYSNLTLYCIEGNIV